MQVVHTDVKLLALTVHFAKMYKVIIPHLTPTKKISVFFSFLNPSTGDVGQAKKDY